MNNREIAKELHKCRSGLLETIGHFDTEQFNKVPFAGSWTAGQVAEHLIKSTADIPEILTGETETAERPADEKEPSLRAIFLDFSKKFEANAAIAPGEGPHDKNRMQAALTEIFDRLGPLAETLDLTEICAPSFPTLGALSRFEWLIFVTYHMHRHTRQMHDILHKLGS